MPFDTEVAEDTLDAFPSEYECSNLTYAALEIKGPQQNGHLVLPTGPRQRFTHIRSI